MQFFQLNLSGKRDTNTCFHCRCFIKGFQKRLCIPVCAFSLKADRITTFRQTLQAVSCLDIVFPLFIQKFSLSKTQSAFHKQKKKTTFLLFFSKLNFFRENFTDCQTSLRFYLLWKETIKG